MNPPRAHPQTRPRAFPAGTHADLAAQVMPACGGHASRRTPGRWRGFPWGILAAPAAQAAPACGVRADGRPPVRRRGFTLVELLVTISVILLLLGVALPVLGRVLADARLQSSAMKVRAGLQRTRVFAEELRQADRNITAPRIEDADYTGTALVFRWKTVEQRYEIFACVNNQEARSGNNYLESLGSDGNPSTPPNLTQKREGYSRIGLFEPFALAEGIRVVGLRRNNAKPHGLEIVATPDSAFVVCFDPSGSGVPPAVAVSVDLDAIDGAGYDQFNLSAYTVGGTNELITTALPAVIVYPTSDAVGLTVDANLDPNELLTKANGRLLTMTLQGGGLVEY